MTDQLLRPRLAYIVRLWAEPHDPMRADWRWRVSVQSVNGTDQKGLASLEDAMAFIEAAMDAEG